MYIAVVFFNSFLHGLVCFSDIKTLPHLQTTPPCFFGSAGSFGLTSQAVNVVLHLKTVHIPCCSRKGFRNSFDVW